MERRGRAARRPARAKCCSVGDGVAWEAAQGVRASRRGGAFGAWRREARSLAGLTRARAGQ
eukprot:4638997-Lingulodinium_polyedra.AAC.1